MPYTPSNPPADLSLPALLAWTQDELRRVSLEFSETTALELRPIFKAPTNPREGMIVFADGTRWNPGGGKGAYQFLSNAWVKL